MQHKPQNNNKSVRRRYRICSDVILQNISLSVEEALTLLSFAFGNISVSEKSLPFKIPYIFHHLLNKECDKVATLQKSTHFSSFI